LFDHERSDVLFDHFSKFIFFKVIFVALWLHASFHNEKVFADAVFPGVDDVWRAFKDFIPV